jgi:hypothetical protein
VKPETLKAFALLIDALRALIHEMGTGPFCLVMIAVVAGFVGFSMWRDKRRASHSLQIVEHKEKEIERLAEDNRRYREVYLAKLGAPPELLEQDRQDSISATQERKKLKGGKKS